MYRIATLYSAEQKRVAVHGPYIPYHVREPIRAFNSEDIFDGKEVRHVLRLPVERWIFDGVEFFIALDPTLRDIVESMINSKVQVVEGNRLREVRKLNDEIKDLQSRTIWDMICSKLRRVKCLK